MSGPGQLTHELDDDVLIVHQNGVTDPDLIVEGMLAAFGAATGPSTHLIWHANDAPAQATPDKMKGLLESVAQAHGRLRLSARMALVVDTELQYGVSRMFSVYAEDYGIEPGVFYDLQEAVDWLRGKSM